MWKEIKKSFLIIAAIVTLFLVYHFVFYKPVYDDGYSDGVKNSYEDYYNEGYADGYNTAYDVGRYRGLYYGYEEGYKAALEDYYDSIYEFNDFETYIKQAMNALKYQYIAGEGIYRVADKVDTLFFRQFGATCANLRENIDNYYQDDYDFYDNEPSYIEH